MAVQTQFRRGNTVSHSTFTGAVGEVTIDLDKKVAVVHDGATAGGFPLTKAQDLTTANVTEVSNQYFTNARARAALSVTGAATYDNLTGVINVTGGVTSVGGATGAVSNVQLANAIISSGILTTANVAELTNLYFTNARVYANVVAGNFATQAYVGTAINNLIASAPSTLDTLNEIAAALGNDNNFASSILTIVGNKANTSVVASSYNQANVAFEQANVAFATSNANFSSANTYVNTRLLTKANVSDLTTANVSELNNLYFTNARVNAALTTQTLDNATFSGTVAANVLTASNIVITPEVRSAGGTTHLYTSDIGIVAIDVNGGQTKFYNSSVEVPGDILGGSYGGNRLRLTDNYASLQGLRNNRVQIQTGDVGSVNNTWTFSGVDGSLTVPGNIVPSSNLVHNLGSPTNRWKDLYLSGNTIDLGGTTISSTAGGGLTFDSANIAGTMSANIVHANVWDGLYTSNVIEVSSNLFYTNARARAALSPSTGVVYDPVTGSIGIGQNVHTSANVTFDIVNITGNLNVYGNAVSFQSNTLVINDPIIEVGRNNPSDALDLGWLGHYNDGVERHTGIFRDATDGKFKVYYNLTTEPNQVTIDTADATFKLGAFVANVFEGNLNWNYVTNRPTTDGINEGSSNLYFTTARVYSNVLSLGLATNAQIATYATLGNLTIAFNQANTAINQANVNFSEANAKIVVASNQANVNFSEANAKITVAFNQANTAFAQANISFDTANINFTSANTYINTRLLTKANVSDLNTSNVAEGSNLYFSNSRVYANIVAGNFTTAAYVTSYVSSELGNLVASAPEALDTLNELAAALGNDSNFSTSILTIVGNKANSSVVASSFDQANLAYSQANVATIYSTSAFNQGNVAFAQANIAFAQANVAFNSSNARLLLKANTADLTTANVLEASGNLYFTNARVISALTPGSGIAISANGLITGSQTVTPVTSSNTAPVDTTGVWIDTQGNVSVYFNGWQTIARALPTNYVDYTYNDETYTATKLGIKLEDIFNVFPETAAAGNYLYFDGSNWVNRAPTTAEIGEGNNLYFTNARVATALTSSGLINTSNLSEGSNLYFTNSRVASALTAGDGISIQANGTVSTSFTSVFEVDDISYYADGFTNKFPLTFNQDSVTLSSPLSLTVQLNGIVQPSFTNSYDPTWNSFALCAYKGYTIEDNQLKFVDPPRDGSQIMIRTNAGVPDTRTRTYPFKPVDIMLGD